MTPITHRSTSRKSGLCFDYPELAVFIGCSTGHGDNSLVDVVVAKGATVAVGFEVSIDYDSAEAWTKVFLESLMNGNTVHVAVVDACNSISESDVAPIFIDDVKIAGDRDYVLFN